ncbi:MAG: LPS assembly lipoprotein LptE [Pseudomonadota bacterium]|nr:LPS assembly lipoprotein LptE [Pseudomonadota bacterium]
MVLALSVQACGFTLRGNNAIVSSFDNLNLELAKPQSELSALLQRSLRAAGVSLPSEQLKTAPTLKVSNEQLSTRPVSINPRARASQVELRLSVNIALTVGGKPIIPDETLTVIRTYFQDIENIAGNQEEALIIANELRQELINQLMRRLESAAE